MGPDEARPRKGRGPVRLAGWLLLAGSAFPVAAAVLFGAGADASADPGRWQGATLGVALARRD